MGKQKLYLIRKVQNRRTEVHLKSPLKKIKKLVKLRNMWINKRMLFEYYQNIR